MTQTAAEVNRAVDMGAIFAQYGTVYICLIIYKSYRFSPVLGGLIFQEANMAPCEIIQCSPHVRSILLYQKCHSEDVKKKEELAFICFYYMCHK